MLNKTRVLRKAVTDAMKAEEIKHDMQSREL